MQYLEFDSTLSFKVEISTHLAVANSVDSIHTFLFCDFL